MTTILEALRTLAIGVSLCAVGGCGSAGPLAAGPAIGSEVEQFVQLVNEHRRSIGCAGLEWSGAVARVAQAHSEDMLSRGFFDHRNPSGQSPGDRLRAAGILWTGWAENIAYGRPTAQSALDAWLDSPGHRSNIDNCSLTRHGVGLAGTHWTHVFLRP